MPCGRFPIDRMPVTQADVARRAGVSVKQVSRVINHEDRVSTATRQRVMQAVADLGYVPNVWAQRLARGYSQLIGLCFYDATAAYIDEVLTAMLDFADVHAYRVGLYRFDPAKEADVARMVALTGPMRVDGFVLTPPCDNAAEFIAALQRSHVPFVMLTPHDRRNDVSWVAATTVYYAWADRRRDQRVTQDTYDNDFSARPDIADADSGARVAQRSDSLRGGDKRIHLPSRSAVGHIH